MRALGTCVRTARSSSGQSPGLRVVRHDHRRAHRSARCVRRAGLGRIAGRHRCRARRRRPPSPRRRPPRAPYDCGAGRRRARRSARASGRNPGGAAQLRDDDRDQQHHAEYGGDGRGGDEGLAASSGAHRGRPQRCPARAAGRRRSATAAACGSHRGVRRARRRRRAAQRAWPVRARPAGRSSRPHAAMPAMSRGDSSNGPSRSVLKCCDCGSRRPRRRRHRRRSRAPRQPPRARGRSASTTRRMSGGSPSGGGDQRQRALLSSGADGEGRSREQDDLEQRHGHDECEHGDLCAVHAVLSRSSWRPLRSGAAGARQPSEKAPSRP